MRDGVEGVEDSSPESSIILIRHNHHVEDDVLCAELLIEAEGCRHLDSAQGLNCFPPKPCRGIPAHVIWVQDSSI